ncbi:putative amino acid permease [Nostocoides japonicum T1-X7]|uniref:Putative amino acid permease n=1 Tax=Nostocoides japonicum T1-X7 TaxID=1194083 RepID=A0A077LZ09_9MICO|nr:amino acid permease [Tetrasphaera japonica]CCH79143.1 putative amino acid permease [Tetrasphaera japonica T1-X7]
MTANPEPDISDSTPDEALSADQVGYKQSLGRRQVQMIALGGAIGTGLFLGSAAKMSSTGPALVVSYLVTGAIAYLLMRALGELVLHRATSGGFVSYMREFFGEKWAFVTGWMYWLSWALTGVAELSAVGLYVQYWVPGMPAWATVLIALAVVLAVNLLSAAAFGEFEFWASLLKVAAIVVFLVVGVVVVIARVHIEGHQAGVHNLWSNPGGFWPTTGGFTWYGPLLVMSSVVFAYASIELVGIAAGEMQDAKREVPKAVNAVIFRIAVFYCGSILLLCCILPTSSYKPGTSPFVTVFGAMGIGWMGDLIQAILIVAALSSLNSGLYATGRVLRSMGVSKEAPAFTTKMSRSGVPFAGILMTSAMFVLGAWLNAVDANAFTLALEATSICIVFTWTTIFVCQLKLRHLVKKKIVEPSSFQMPGSPYTSIVGLAFLAFVIVGLAISGWQSSPSFGDKTDFIMVVIGIPVLAILLALGWFAVRRGVSEHMGGNLQSVWSTAGPDRATIPGQTAPETTGD